jgi:thioredoxin reductase (NADPH)
MPPGSRLGELPRPTLVVVDDEDASRAALARELTTRYGTDYTIVVESSPVRALQRLRDLGAAAEEVAVILAAQEMVEMPGATFLATAHEIHPRARRGLLITPAQNLVARRATVQACALGYADYFLIKPVQTPDERFHRAVTEFLDEWWRLRGSTFELIRVVGEERSPRSHEIRDLLQRHDLPYGFYASESEAGRATLVHAEAGAERLPVVIMLDGRALIDPTNREVAEALGVGVRPADVTYDVVIVGGGPAGLAAAVYAGSEGLRAALVEREALGGQAGTSSMIRNSLGVPRGISGAELAARALEQAVLFGTDIVYGSTATALRAEGDRRVVTLGDGTEMYSRAVVIATGVSYRRLEVPALEALMGAGVFYGAGMSEAQALAGESVFVVGGGNSAGQAAVHLSRYAERVTLLVRSGSLAASMSQYLVTEIAATPNIDICYGVEVVGGGGEGRLEGLELKDRHSGEVETVPAAALFVLIGAQPFTQWLPSSVIRDQWGYVLTGAQCGLASCDMTACGPVSDIASSDTRTGDGRAPLLLETNLPGVFAVGDVRRGSVKRVASGAGEGSICIRLVHEYLEAVADQRHQHTPTG